MYSINGNFIIKENFSMGQISFDKEEIIRQSDEQGKTSLNRESSSISSGGTIRVDESSEVIQIDNESTSDRTFSAITDVSTIEETNIIIKNQTKKMTDSYSINENKVNPFNIFDSNIQTDVFPYLLPNTSNISIGNYLGIYMTFTTGNIINAKEMLINFPSGYTAGIILIDSKITPFIGMWWGSDTSNFLEFEDLIEKNFVQMDESTDNMSNKFDSSLDINSNYRLFVEFDLSIPGQTEIKVSLKNLSNGSTIYNRESLVLDDRNISGYSTNDQNIAVGQQVPWPNDSYSCKCNTFSGIIDDVKISRRDNKLNDEQVENLMLSGESDIVSEIPLIEEINFEINVGATNNTNAEINISEKITVTKITFEYISGYVSCSSGESRYGCGEKMIALVLTNYDNKILLPSKKVKGYNRHDIDSALWYTIEGINNSSDSLIWDLNKPIVLLPGLYKVWYCEDLSNFTLSDNSGIAKYNMIITYTKENKESTCDILNKIANEPVIPSNCSKVPLGFIESGQIKCCKDEQTPVLDYFIDRNTAGKFDSGTHNTIETESWELCREECKNDDECLAYEFNSNNNICSLKKTWESGSDDLNFFRLRDDPICDDDCSKWYSGIKFLHYSTCEGNNRPKCALYGNSNLPKCNKCSELKVKSLGLLCKNCGFVGAFIGERNLFTEITPDYGSMGGRGFSVIILDKNFNTKNTANFDTHGDPNASLLLVLWLEENLPLSGYLIILVWDEAMHKLDEYEDARRELFNKYKILGPNINLEYRSPYAAVVEISEGTTKLLQENAYPPYTSPVEININCFIPDDFPITIYSNVPSDDLTIEDMDKDMIVNSKRNFKAVRSMDEIYIKSVVQTPSEFSSWNILALYGGTGCCGGLFFGLHNGKVFLGNQCNEDIILGSILENGREYSLEFFYSKVMRKCIIWIDTAIDIEQEEVDYDIPEGRLSIGSGCHDKDDNIWGYETYVNCKDFERIGSVCFDKPGLTKHLVIQRPFNLVGPVYLILSKNNLIGEFDTTKDYKLDIVIHPLGKVSGWNNIVHATLSDNNCCSGRDRLPGIWFYSNTTRLHIRTATMDIGNDGYDPNIELPLNQDTRVVVIVQDDNLTVELSGGVTFSHTRKISTNRYYGTIKFYAANPWNNVSNAKIKNLTYENLSLTNNEGLACTSGNCSSIYEKCRTQGAHVTSKEELEIWKEQNPDPPATYGITSTRRYDGVNLEHWVDGYGWHFDGCCGNDDRYYVCARSGNEIENSNNCVEGDTACIAKKFSSFADGDLIPPNTPSWSSGIIFEIEIFNRYFSSYVPPEIQESTPDSTNLFNFEKDVKCEDICDLGIQGNKNDSWLCKTSRPLSDLRCCKVDEGQWCPSAVSTVNSEYGMVTLESSGSNRCCCGEVTIEEDVIDTSVRKEDRLFSTDSTFQSIKNSESILQENSSREVIYLDGNNEPIITTSSLKTDPSSNNIIPNETTIDEDSNETSIDNNGNPSMTKSSSQSVTPYSSQNVESPGGGLSYLLIFVLIFLVFYYLVK